MVSATAPPSSESRRSRLRAVAVRDWCIDDPRGIRELRARLAAVAGVGVAQRALFGARHLAGALAQVDDDRGPAAGIGEGEAHPRPVARDDERDLRVDRRVGLQDAGLDRRVGRADALLLARLR